MRHRFERFVTLGVRLGTSPQIAAALATSWSTSADSGVVFPGELEGGCGSG